MGRKINLETLVKYADMIHRMAIHKTDTIHRTSRTDTIHRAGKVYSIHRTGMTGAIHRKFKRGTIDRTGTIHSRHWKIR